MNWPASESDTKRVRAALRKYLATAEGQKELRETYPFRKRPLGTILLAGVVGALTGQMKLRDYIRAQSLIAGYQPFLNDVDGFLSRARLVQGIVIMANEELMKKTSAMPAYPLLAMVGFTAADERFVNSEEWRNTLELASVMAESSDYPYDSKDEALLARMVTDEATFGVKRREVPRSLTKGHAVYLVTVWAHRGWLESRHFPITMALLAEPGPSGVCLQVPHWIEHGTTRTIDL